MAPLRAPLRRQAIGRPPEKLTAAGGSNLWPRLASDGQGRVALVWQGFRDNQAVILAREAVNGKWSAERQVSEGAGNCWAPSAAYIAGKLWVAWDSYSTGAYQVYAREGTGPVERITRGDEFLRAAVPRVGGGQTGNGVGGIRRPLGQGLHLPVRPARHCDLQEPPHPHGLSRRVRMERDCLAHGGGRRQRCGASCSSRNSPPMPAAGCTWHCALRTSAGTARIDYWASQGRWETFVTHLDGGRWTPAVPMPRAWAATAPPRPSPRSAAARTSPGPPTIAPGPGAIRRAGRLHLDAGRERRFGAARRWQSHRRHSVRRRQPASQRSCRYRGSIRAYRIKINGKEYRILRGDLHRHTELSNDGAGDGSLDDLYRYTLDAAAMDYAHVGDHQMGNDEEYNWWITQKSNDLYFMPQRFVPLYGYERSVR